MRFQVTTALFAISLSNIAFAQDAAYSSKVAQFESDFLAYYTATLITDPAYQALATNTAELAALQSLGLSADSPIGATDLSSKIAALPSSERPLISSIAAVATSIALKDGLLTTSGTGLVTATSTSGASTSERTTGSSTNSRSSSVTSVAAMSSSTTSASASASSTAGASRNGMEIGVLGGAVMGLVGFVAAL